MVIQTDRADDPCPLDRAGLARSVAPFGQSRMLPREAYVSDAVFAWEQRNFFEAGWMCIGRSEDMPNPADQKAISVGRSGVFLMRDQGRTLRAFANACRHRGHELLPCGQPAVNRSIVVCPYHAWSYHLDGSLRMTPGFDPEHVDTATHGLVELACSEWHGWIFVDCSGDAGPIEQHLAGLEPLVAPYEPERLVTRGRHEYVVEANWKVLNENYQESYHCPMIHPELCNASPPRSGENYTHPDQGAWVGGWMELRDEMETMSLDGKSSASIFRGLVGEARRHVEYIGVFPNLLISLHPDYVMTHTLTPLTSGTTHIVCSWAFAPEDVERDTFDPSFAVDFWDITNRQDWLACESVQRGLSSPKAIPGPLSNDEDGVYQLVSMIARGYSGLPIVAGTLSEAL
ncbi:MAG: aromatic ring-hydroxylating dioxygenase subunit alpha [Acidimicrobiales bacterium]